MIKNQKITQAQLEELRTTYIDYILDGADHKVLYQLALECLEASVPAANEADELLHEIDCNAPGLLDDLIASGVLSDEEVDAL